MSAHNVLQQLLLASYEINDPGQGGSIVLDRSKLSVPLITTETETSATLKRTLPQPTSPGLEVTIWMKTDAGDCLVTVTGGYNQAGTTGLTFDTAGDWVTLHSVGSGSSYYWRVLASEGFSTALEAQGPINFGNVTGPLITTTTPYTGAVVLTGTYASAVSNAVTLSATNQRPFSFLSDDAGAALATGVYRPLLSRVYLGKDQSGVTIIPSRGQLKLATGIDVATGIYAGVQGYLELAGTHIASSGATLSCLSASLEVTTSLTAASGGEVAGLHVETTGAGTLTATGTIAGILIDKASGAASWPDGILIDGPSVVMGMRIGKFAGSAVTTSAVLFSAAQNVYSDGQASVFEVHGGSDANLGSGYAAKCARLRHVVNCTTAAHETYGAMGQCVVKGTTLTHLHAGVIGTFEGHTSGVVANSAYEFGVAGVMARCGGGAAITATTDVCGFSAFWNGAACDSGSSVALGIGDQGTAAWDVGIGVTRATNLFALPADATAPVAAGNYEVHGGTKVRIAILVGGSQYYMLASTAPTTQS